MSKKLLVLVLAVAVIGLVLGLDSAEAKKSSRKGISEEDVTTMSNTVDSLTRKMYGNCLFSPQDNQNLIEIKLKLDNQMLVAPDVSLAPLYYKVAVLYKSRDMKDEAIDCFQTILENFSDTALAPKAAAQLKSMGVAVKAPSTKPAAGSEE